MAEDRLDILENTVKELKAEIEKLKDDISIIKGKINDIIDGEMPEGFTET